MSVVTEVMHMLDFNVLNQSRFLEWIGEGGTDVVGHAPADWERCAYLLTKYSDLPADFADVSLVAACERYRTRRIATIDSDFKVYRYNDRHPFENVFPTD